MPKYCLKFYYQPELLDKITEDMQHLVPDWKQGSRRLEVCRVYEFETGKPLPEEVIAKLWALKEDWMNDLELEEVKD